MSPDAWFEGISGQLFSLFDGEAGPDLAKTAAQIVGFGILGKRQFGAPGMLAPTRHRQLHPC